jgi:hypothetical protein
MQLEEKETENLFSYGPSDFVEGIVFRVTRKELEHSDAYEPAGYGRVVVQLRSGRDAWVYLNNKHAPGS